MSFAADELKTDELVRLHLSRKQSVEWWPGDCVPINGRVNFYYSKGRTEEGKGLDNPLELVPVYPSCLLIRESVVYDEKFYKSVVRIEGLPGGISKIRFSHYHIGPDYEQFIEFNSESGSSSSSLQKKVECAPITFLKKAPVKKGPHI